MITITGMNNKTTYNISTADKDFGDFDTEGCVEAMEALNGQYPGACKLVTVGANSSVVHKALDLTGMSEFEKAKALSQSEIVF